MLRAVTGQGGATTSNVDERLRDALVACRAAEAAMYEARDEWKDVERGLGAMVRILERRV
jgi:hypothetical protein